VGERVSRASLTDEDGVDGPFERRIAAAPRRRSVAAAGEVVTTARPRRRTRRDTPSTLPAPTPTLEDLSEERKLGSRTVPCVVLTPDLQTDLARWSQWQVTLATATSEADLKQAREEARSYAAAIMHRLVAANPALCPGHAEHMGEIERRRHGGEL
jgi:hypothetical protein